MTCRLRVRRVQGDGFGCEEFGAEGGVEVAAGEDGDDFLRGGKLVGVEERGGEGDGAGGLGGEVGGGEDDAEGGADFVFGDGDDAVDELEDVLRSCARRETGCGGRRRGCGWFLRRATRRGFGVEGFFGVGGELGFAAEDRAGAGSRLRSALASLMAVATPESRPPPETGERTRSTLGSCSRISRPQVAWPAMMASSS